jgi:urease beta subunit
LSGREIRAAADNAAAVGSWFRLVSQDECLVFDRDALFDCLLRQATWDAMAEERLSLISQRQATGGYTNDDEEGVR